MSQHLIFGAGLIGGYMAGSFASKGVDVTVLGRESLRKRFETEFTVTDYQGNRASTSEIKFIDGGEAVDTAFDFIWLTVKCTGIEQALLDMAKLVSPSTTILSCQNGLGSDNLVRASFPNNTVRRVIMTSNVAQQSDTHLHRGSEGDLFVEAHSDDGDTSLASLVSSDLLIAQNIESMQAYSWAKLQLNLANAVNALADIPVKQMLEHRVYRQIIAGAMQELIDVSRAKGLRLPKLAAVPMRFVPLVLNTPNVIFSILGSKMMDIDPTVRTSMWWDINNGRLTEVDVLNGAVVAEGKKLGLKCPINQKIVEMVHQVERSGSREGFDPISILGC